MRSALGLIWSLVTVGVLALGCGETASNDDHGGAGQGTGGTSSTAGGNAGGASSAGTTSSGGSNAGTSSTGGSAQAGSASGGTSGNATGGAGGSATGGTASGGSAAGGSATGGAGPVDCDPHKILCRIVTPECPQGEVPSVNGSCYGECVKIDRCSCTTADECPQPEQFTCLKGPMHCSYYLK
jgi:hypothetical protein